MNDDDDNSDGFRALFHIISLWGPSKKLGARLSFLGPVNMDLGPGKKIEIPLCPFSTLTTVYI